MTPNTMNRLPQKADDLLARCFFEAPPEQVAPRLLGKILVRTMKGRKPLMGRIVEVEAYLGPHSDPPDPAAHAHRGRTPRNAVLFGPPGHAYVYSIYGLHFCMNISCDAEGRAGCVLLRALEPLEGIEQMARNRGLSSPGRGPVRRGPGLKPHAPPRLLASGPGRLCQALALTRAAHNGVDLLDPASPLQVRDDGFTAREVLVTPRIGIRHPQSIGRLLRFALAENACVSGPRTFVGRRVFLDYRGSPVDVERSATSA